MEKFEKNSEFSEFEIVFEAKWQEYSLYGYGVYPHSSVLHGQQRRIMLKSFGSLKEAQVACPSATVVEEARYVPRASVPQCPEDWFDPSAAGESWDEDY